MPEKQATYEQLKEVLKDYDSLLSALEITDGNLYIPTDGNGLRIRVCGPKGQCKPGKKKLNRTLRDGQSVVVKVEISDDYSPIEPLDNE